MLSDSKIKEALDYKEISVLPLGENAIQPASIDLRLGEEILIHRTTGDFYTWNLRTDGPHSMNPGDFILGVTYEWITIGKKYVGELVGKSSRAREGIIVESAGHFDPEWDGFGTVELSNRSRTPVLLTYKMPICQMRFHVVVGEVERGYGHPELGSHYQLAMGPEQSWTQQPHRAARVKVMPESDEMPVVVTQSVYGPDHHTLETPPTETPPSASTGFAYPEGVFGPPLADPPQPCSTEAELPAE